MKDQIANKVLQEFYHDIVNQVNVDEVSSRLFSKRRITLSELNRLQNLNGALIDQQRRYLLYCSALANKGKLGLDTFLAVLDETGIQYDEHADLAEKLRSKFTEYESLVQEQGRDEGTNRTLGTSSSSPNVVTSPRKYETPSSLQGSTSSHTGSCTTMPQLLSSTSGSNHAITASYSGTTDSTSHVTTSLNNGTVAEEWAKEVLIILLNMETIYNKNLRLNVLYNIL